MVDKILVREYLSSLNEDGELDRLVVSLLESLDFIIIRTARETKGHSQYGKDIVAAGKDSLGVMHLWFIEVKGYDQRDINIKNYSKADGIRESLIESKDTPFNFVGHEDLKNLPRKYVVAHNGITDDKFKETFNGFISTNFADNEFEDWDLHKLVELFSNNLFNSYLFHDNTSERLFKRLLIFLSVPEYDFEDLKLLFQLFEANFTSNKKFTNRRKFLNFFSSVNLLMQMSWHYADESENMNPAKYVVDYCILNTWAIVIKYNKEKSRKFLNQFDFLLHTQLRFYTTYYNKTIEVAISENGLFNSKEFIFEQIGYSLRCSDYLDFLVYYFQLNNAFVQKNEQLNRDQNFQKEALKLVIRNNQDGCYKLFADYQIIAFHHVIKFFLGCMEIHEGDLHFIMKSISKVFEQFFLRKRQKVSFVYSAADLTKLIQREFKDGNMINYPDEESIMLPVLIEYLAVFNMEALLEQAKGLIEDIDLQIVRPDFALYEDLEVLMFRQNLYEEDYVEMVTLDFTDTKKLIESRRNATRENYTLKTKEAGYDFLITLAQTFYKNEPYPEEWREWFNRINIRIENENV